MGFDQVLLLVAYTPLLPRCRRKGPPEEQATKAARLAVPYLMHTGYLQASSLTR